MKKENGMGWMGWMTYTRTHAILGGEGKEKVGSGKRQPRAHPMPPPRFTVNTDTFNAINTSHLHYLHYIINNIT